MDDASAILTAALLGGIVATMLRLPPLLGFLAAGFVLHGLGVEQVAAIQTLGDLGVTILLFGVGLKLDLRALARREVWLTTTVHLVLTVVAVTGVLGAVTLLGVSALAGSGWRTWALIGFAMSFSSTVFAVKLLEDRGGASSLGGRTAIGVLVFQDLAAVTFLAVSEGEPPSPWALLLLILLLPGGLVLRVALDRVGHDELLPLFGVVLALVPGYALFDAVGVKGDLGALAMGMLLASHRASGELSRSLFAVKDLLLVGFFVSIGLSGTPTASQVLVIAVLVLLLPLKGVGFAFLLWASGFRRRTAVLTGLSLANFSEFGLIVVAASPAALLGAEWVTVVATAVAISFLLASLTARRPEPVVERLRRAMPARSADRVHPEDRLLDVGEAQAVVLGMGRVGRAAYERLSGGYGMTVLGIETSLERTQRLVADGLQVVEGDATDPELFERLPTGGVSIVLLAMPRHHSNLDAMRQLRSKGFTGTVAVVAQFDEDLAQAREQGADAGFQLYDGVGAELADRAAAHLAATAGRP
jgi:glutathione-regulated potassium-efflux system ancillary protein KefC